MKKTTPFCSSLLVHYKLEQVKGKELLRCTEHPGGKDTCSTCLQRGEVGDFDNELSTKGKFVGIVAVLLFVILLVAIATHTSA